MPLPFLLAGLAVGVLGAGAHMSATDTNKTAQRRSAEAVNLYKNAKRSFDKTQNETEKALLTLGYEKKNVLGSSMDYFFKSYEKVKDIQITESVGINELSKFTFDQQDAIQIREMTDIYSSTIQSGTAGAAAGTIVALAASGSLPMVAGGLATAGSALMAGEIGLAASAAGSALSVGVAATPLAAIVAPALLFTGFSASIKADENLEKANAQYAEAEAAVEKMRVSETLFRAITERSEMYNDLLLKLDVMFSECTAKMAGVIKKREGKIRKRKLTSRSFSEEEMKLMAVTCALAKAVKTVIDTPILSTDGKNVSVEAETTFNLISTEMPHFDNEVKEIEETNYRAKSVKIKAKKYSYEDALADQAKKNKRTNAKNMILHYTRNLLAFTIGCFIATKTAAGLADIITTMPGKFLFLDLYTANQIAIWLVLCTFITRLLGNFKKSAIVICCAAGFGIGMSILYGEYCRVVGQMQHGIIFTIVILSVLSILNILVVNYQMRFLAYVESLVFVPVCYLLYSFFSNVVGISSNFCLACTTFFVLIVPIGVAIGECE